MVTAKRLTAMAALAVVLVFILSPLFNNKVFATSVGPNSPTGGAANNCNAGNTAWSTPGNVTAQDAANATVTLSSATNSQCIFATGFGFSIDPTAIINGVVVSVYKSSAAVSNQTMEDQTVSLLVGGSVTGSNKATTTAWPTTNQAVSYGSSTDTWGVSSLTVAQVNATNFGVAVAAANVHVGGKSNSATANVDYISVSVYYTLPSLFNQASYRLFNNADASSYGTFAAKVDYTTGTGPQSVTAADFNGDGKPDLAVANKGANTVSVFINNGNGTFATKVDYATGSGPPSVTAADFNGDGKPDLAVANNGANTVSVLLNNGDGTFAAKVDYATGTTPWSVTVADFNGDGKPDLAVANYGANTVSVLLNNGNGTFAAKVDYATGSASVSVTAADFNGDGKPDLAVANQSSNTVSVLLNNGDGTFAAKVDYTPGTGAYAVTAADFNGDGKPDLAVANWGSLGSGTTVSVLLNNGNGTFAAKVDYTTGSGPQSVTAADLNGDGKPDLAVANNGPGTVSTLMNNGNGTFATKVDYATGTSPYAVTAADFNGDGKPDLAVANQSSNTVSVLMNVSSPIDVGTALAAQNTAATVPGDSQAFRLRMDVGASQANLAASGQLFKLQYALLSTSCSATPSANFNDVTDTSTVRYYDNPVATNAASLTINANDPSDGTNTTANGGVVPETYQEKGTTTFTNPTAIPVGKDGMWDFALTTYHTLAGQHYCLRMVSSTGTPLTTYTTYPEIITPATTYNQAAYRWFANANTAGAFGLAPKVDYTTGSSPYSVTAADFNGDGKVDLAVANSYNGTGGNTVSIFLNNGDGTFATKVDYTTAGAPESVTAADFNGDGKVDLAVAARGGFVSLLMNNGDGTFATKVDYTDLAEPVSITTADFNGDGHPDLAVANYGGSGTGTTTSVFLNNGDGTFAAQVNYTTGTGAVSVTAADLNGDGHPDLAVANYGANTVSVLLNNGNGTFATKVDYTTGTTPISVTAADLNGDGHPDLAVANYGANTVSVLLNNGNGTFATKVDYTAGTNPNSVTTADFNGDGHPDLAVANYGANTVSVPLNTSTGIIGSPLAAAGKAGDINSLGTPYRLRLDLAPVGSGVAVSGQSFKLQYAVKNGTCAASTFADITTSTPVQWYDNSNLTGGTDYAYPDSNDPTDGTNTLVNQTYQEANNFTNTQSAVYVGQDGLWDFSLLVPTGTSVGTDICLRAVTSSGTPLASYGVYPEIQYGPSVKQRMRLGKWFDSSGVNQPFFLPR